MEEPKVVLPGSTIGMVGGGQLGRMFATAAAAMGYRTVVFCKSADEPAAQVACDTVTGDLDDAQAIDRFASQCDVITLEFENIPAKTIARCQRIAPTYPSSAVLATAQDRLVEKETLAGAGLPVTPFRPIQDAETLCHAGEDLGWPLVVKTAHSGYDGKGQYRVQSPAEVDQVRWTECDRWIAEQWIDFDCEVSAIVARAPNGEHQSFPVFENAHRNHILDVTSVPATIDNSMEARVREIAVAAADTLDLIGLLCVEFFICGEQAMINEVAPRPHNSGHLTIEACETSQFAQHVRAVCNLPLGNTELRCRAAAMVNLLGDLWNDGEPPPWDRALQDRSISLHLYGKAAAKPGRKMGHMTITGSDRDQLVERICVARGRLETGG